MYYVRALIFASSQPYITEGPQDTMIFYKSQETDKAVNQKVKKENVMSEPVRGVEKSTVNNKPIEIRVIHAKNI